MKKLDYLQGYDTARIDIVRVYQPVIKNGDILSIIVNTPDNEINQMINEANGIGGGGNLPMGATNLAGYIVDVEGDINFPLVGKLHVAGLSKSELIDSIKVKLASFISSDPVVNIRFLNYRVNVLGEVNNPGVFTVNNERLTVVEAVALAGNLTNHGRRDNVLIIREENGRRVSGRIDLKDPNVFSSPFYYLQQNDIVLVQMNRNKITWSDQGAVRNITTIGSIVGTIGLVVTIILTVSR